MKLIFTIVWIFLGIGYTNAQTTRITGTVTDIQTGEALVGINIAVQGKMIGTITDTKGHFELKSKTPPPFILVFSSVGYALKEIEIRQTELSLNVQLEEEILLGKEIVISASRVEESLLESPVSIEKMDILQLRETPATNFYEALSSIKGVDMSTQSLTFSNPNTRGFNGNTNYRVNQMIDEVDNAPPGLSFAAGNIVGISPLDVESVELLVGASSALYGPGGVNGTILMRSKSPFEYQGLSASVQTGIMHVNAGYTDHPNGMYDLNLRFAKAYKNKFAFKVNVSYLTALDWHANDTRDRNDLGDASLTPATNPAYDGVNIYGDEAIFPVDLGSDEVKVPAVEGVIAQLGLTPGTSEYEARYNEVISLFPEKQLVTRSGFAEKYLGNYDTESLKLNASLHYRLSEEVEAILQGNYGKGNSLYTAATRFALVDFSLYNVKAELRGKDFFLRAWTVGEDAGTSYDVGGLALRLNEALKPSEDWYADYVQGFLINRLFGSSIDDAYRAGRESANATVPLPRSAAFQEAMNQIISTPVNEGGALVVDKTRMYNFEGMYNLSRFFKFVDFITGLNYRIYSINSEGTVFGDEPGKPHIVHQFGAYFQVIKHFLRERLKLTGSARYDKNEFFEGRLTPRGSLVYALDQSKKHYLRASIQTAFRFPSIADQFTNLDVGFFQVIGGLPKFRQPYNFNENTYPLDDSNPLVGKADFSQGTLVFPEFKPERVTTYEVGYKGLLTPRFFVDGYVYYNEYNGFIATQSFVQNPDSDGTGGQKFQTAVSTDQPVNAYGWAIGGDYYFRKGYKLGANVAYNTLDSPGIPVGFQTNFNSPDYRFNLSVSNREVIENIGFSINWRWQNEFLWESTFGVARVSAYHTLDAQVSYQLKKIKSILKVGGSNLLNRYYTTGFGNPQIGAIYYVTFTFDEFLN